MQAVLECTQRSFFCLPSGKRRYERLNAERICRSEWWQSDNVEDRVSRRDQFNDQTMCMKGTTHALKSENVAADGRTAWF